MLKLDDIHIRRGALSVLEGASLSIGPAEKAGLAGVNGSGKTTLLQIAAGQVIPDSGKVTRPKTLAYLPQEPKLGREFDDDSTVRDVAASGSPLAGLARDLEAAERALEEVEPADLDRAVDDYGALEERYRHEGGYKIEADAGVVLHGLGMGYVELDREVGNLSSGERTRLEMARVLMSNADLLLLDEPTNHLDENGVGWLMEYLAGIDAAVLLVSHDLRLLDRSISRVFEMDPVGHTVNQYKGTHSEYLETSEVEKVALGKTRDRRLAEMNRLQSQADSFRGKTEKMARKAKVFDRRVARMKADLPQIARDPKSIAVKIPPAPRSGRVVAEVESLNKSYGANHVLKDVRFQLERGERLAVIGVNGAGKTTLLKIISGVTEADSGRVELGYNVVPGYYSQEIEDELADVTPYDQVRPLIIGGETKVRSVLAQFLLSADHAFRPASTLSGGEKVRLALAKLMLTGCNLFILDEPTSNLDKASKQRLLESLREYGGSVIAVSHDRDFVEGLNPDRALTMPGARFEPFAKKHLALVEIE